MARRVRRHANPFSCDVALGALDQVAMFGREAPLELEIGPGSASFLFDRAAACPDADFIGIEVRKPMVEQAMARRERMGLKNAVVLYANANINLKTLVSPELIRRFHVHFPDPWVKKRHWKRRIMQPQLVRDMAQLMAIGGEIYAQSDVPNLAREMYYFLEQDGCLKSKLDPSMLVDRPLPEFTDWEKHHEEIGEPIYRMLFEKVREVTGPVPDLAHQPAELK
jgi:tRNA (guanine-N7-)-methyltransferase